MYRHEIVVHHVERNGGDVALDLLREGIRGARNGPDAHPNREISAFDVAGGNVRGIGMAGNGLGFAANALSGVVPLLAFGSLAIDLDELGIVDFTAKGTLDSLEVNGESVTGELDAIGQPSGQVVHEDSRRDTVARPNDPGLNQFGIRVDSRPGPHAAGVGVHCGGLRSGVPGLRFTERPALVYLYPFAEEIAQHSVLICGTHRAEFQ